MVAEAESNVPAVIVETLLRRNFSKPPAALLHWKIVFASDAINLRIPHAHAELSKIACTIDSTGPSM
jgi:hypothetical protein